MSATKCWFAPDWSLSIVFKTSRRKLLKDGFEGVGVKEQLNQRESEWMLNVKECYTIKLHHNTCSAPTVLIGLHLNNVLTNF